MIFDRTKQDRTGQGSQTDSRELGQTYQTYGWDTTIYGARRRKRRKEASMEKQRGDSY